MLDYLIGLLNFSANGHDYNLLLTPWIYLCSWRDEYIAHASNGTGAWSTAVRDADIELLKFGLGYTFAVLILLIVCVWFVNKIAVSFTGWMRIK